MIEPRLSTDEPMRLHRLRCLSQLDTPLEERFERITRLAQRLLDAPIAAISLVDADRQWFKSIQGFAAEETSRRISFCGHAILHDDVLVVEDARRDARFAGNPLVTGPPNVVFYAGCPIRSVDGSTLGSLCVIDRKPRKLSREDLQALQDLAKIAELEFSTAMDRGAQEELIKQVDALARIAHVDSLTRVWNRESIFRVLEKEIAAAKQAGRSACVIMADLDRFKPINDTHGHVVGDEVLRQAAKRMLGAIREVDALGRYGGEEFMIVPGNCEGLESAREVAERVRERIGGAAFHTESRDIEVTVSLGVAYCDDPGTMTVDALVKGADDALYRAKDNGRNRVETAIVSGEGAAKAA
ncbi:MAG: sensor domain-containing diguanylate cyclase [Phycisphaeraceae bacterium]|nr:MAG: sensor domain-containing diguanylate cyclase [Phycisphaeraceae bacterium]